jgi:hypothetical protein
MRIDFVPLLELQRTLYNIPLGRERFEEYLRIMQNDRRDDLKLPPLCAMNPMGKDHCASLLDQWLSLDADAVGAHAAADAAKQLADMEGAFKIGLVLVDDLRGGGTNRYTSV